MSDGDPRHGLPLSLPYGRHWIDDADVEAVAEVLRGDWLTTGPWVERFERALCEVSGAAHCAVVNSGTAALHSAYFAAGLGRGDAIVTSPLTFASTAISALHLGADVRFADVEPDTGLLDLGAASAAIDAHTRLVVPVDYAGHPVDGAGFERLVRERGLGLVVDAAHSLGARRAGRSASEVGDACTTSFHPVKPVTTAEGGAVLTPHAEWAERVRLFRNHGIERDPDRQQAPGGAWHYEITEPGFNYRLPDVLCALGLSQLRRLDAFLERRREVAHAYQEAFADLSALELPTVRPGTEPGWHLYVVRVREASRRRVFFDALRERGIGAQVHYEPVHLQPLFRARGSRPGDCPVAEDFAARALSLPIYPRMQAEDVARAIESVRGVAKALL